MAASLKKLPASLTLIALALLCFCDVSVSAQVSSNRVIYTTANPPTVCTPNKLYTNSGTLIHKVWLGLADGTCQQLDAANGGAGSFTTLTVSGTSSLGVASATSLDVPLLNPTSAFRINLNSEKFLHTLGGGGGGDVYENLFLGYKAGNSAAGTGYANTVVGRQAAALLNGTSPNGSSNSIFGYGAFSAATTASFNTVFGTASAQLITTEQRNSFFGYHAGNSATGSNNTGVGSNALASNTADANTGVGYFALNANTTGIRNTGVGYNALQGNNTANDNTALGYAAMSAVTGVGALGFENTAIGSRAGDSTTTGYTNTFVGSDAGGSNSTGNGNTLIGRAAGTSNSVGTNNVYVGLNAADAATGSSNILVGANIDTASAGANNDLNIGGVITGASTYTPNNSKLHLATTGTVISRNIADANPALIVDQVHASSTGKILSLRLASGEKFSVSSSGSVTALIYLTDTNCADSAGAAACGSASAGHFVIDAASTSTVVSTTSVTANSQIILTRDNSLGTRLSVTCNTQSSLTLGAPYVSARTAGTSFTVTIDAGPTTSPMCIGYKITN